MKKFYPSLFALFFCLAGIAQAPQLVLVPLPTNFNSAIDIKNCGDNRIFVVEQEGQIYIMDKAGNVSPTPFLDISSEVNSNGNEQGLLSLAFSPNYKQDGYFYVNYINGSGAGKTRISRFQVTTDSNVADPSSEQVLLQFTQPYSNHNGATLMFGHDGYLYDTQGDGGSEYDPQLIGQMKNTFLSKVLRFDVSNPDTTYTVPPTNPFVGDANYLPEIWATGVRNPWRCSIDHLLGDMWIGDVGQDNWEEVDFQPAVDTGGENYGWSCREGFHVCPTTNTAGCPSTGFTDPVAEYSHGTNYGQGCAILGGYVYRGAEFANMWGLYFYSDLCTGTFWDIGQPSPGVFVVDTLIATSGHQWTTFGEDNDGELYVSDRNNGIIYHLTESSNCNPVAFITLQDTISACNTASLTALYGDTLSYQWYNASGPISGATSNQYQTAQSGWYKVMVSKAQLGCTATSDSVYVNIHLSDALLPCNCSNAFCVSQAATSINQFFNPAGGVYSGNGVSNDSIFTPSVAGIGTDSVTYVYTNSFGCISSAGVNLQVGDSTALIAGPIVDSTYCTLAMTLSLSGFVSPVGGVYSGLGISSDTVLTMDLAPFPQRISYSYTNNYGCISSDSFTLHIYICEGIKEVGEGISFNIFPNPNNGMFSINVQVNNAQQADLTIADELGRVCFQKNQMLEPAQPLINLQLGHLSKGVYNIELKSTKGTASRKLVIE